MPCLGDLMIWGRLPELPFGHVGVVAHISDTWDRIAEQNHRIGLWAPGKNYSRQLERRARDDRIVEFIDSKLLLGLVKLQSPAYDFAQGDLPDHYRHILSPGRIVWYGVKGELVAAVVEFVRTM